MEDRLDVVSDAKVAALKYKFPKLQYQSVMQTRQDNRPSLRESLLRTGHRPHNQRPSRA